MRAQFVDGQFVVRLTAKEAVRYGVVTPTASAPAERTYATKAERQAGNGFTCSCGRDDLRVAPVTGRSFHKDPEGNLHDLR